MRYGNLRGALPKDCALEQQWPRSGSRHCQSLNMHKFLDICLNGASEKFINIYAKNRCQWNGYL